MPLSVVADREQVALTIGVPSILMIVKVSIGLPPGKRLPLKRIFHAPDATIIAVQQHQELSPCPDRVRPAVIAAGVGDGFPPVTLIACYSTVMIRVIRKREMHWNARLRRTPSARPPAWPAPSPPPPSSSAR